MGKKGFIPFPSPIALELFPSGTITASLAVIARTIRRKRCGESAHPAQLKRRLRGQNTVNTWNPFFDTAI
jgi:hypothetical protein